MLFQHEHERHLANSIKQEALTRTSTHNRENISLARTLISYNLKTCNKSTSVPIIRT